MRTLYIALFAFFALSCTKSNNYIYYSYGNTTITRIDEGTNIYFYYGRYEDVLPRSYIRASYHGFDGLMSCYLIFNDNGIAEIVDMEGSFEIINSEKKIKLIKFNNNMDFIRWEKKIKLNHNNVIELSNVLKIEIARNELNKSKILTEYPNN